MIRKASLAILIVLFLAGSFLVVAQSHHDHVHPLSNSKENHLHPETSPQQAKLVTGQGEFIFSWDKELSAAFPDDALEFEPAMHGGFNEDPETGIVYTGIPGYGLCSISADLKTWTRIGSDERLKDNIHGIVFFVHKGEKRLAIAQEGKRVLVLDLEGNIVSEIRKPIGDEFDFPQANEFFSSKDSNFGVTDVSYLKGTIYVVHGYSRGDFALTIIEDKGDWKWGSLAWGGKGDEPGQFQTAHGVYAKDNHILIANRAAGQVVKFTKKGKFVELFEDVPEGSLICNVSYKAEHYFMNALQPIGDQKSAPIYVHTGKKLKSTIVAGELEIPIITNIHQVWPHIIQREDGTEQFYLLIHAWNKGKFAVLKLE